VELNTVTMPAQDAAKAFREYRAAFMAERNRIDGELMRGYKALAEGKTLISLTEAITAGGADEIGRPRLAIARADEARVQMTIEASGEIRFNPNFSGLASSSDRLFRFPPGVFPIPPRTGVDSWQEPWAGRWEASLPFIPPQYRPPLAIQNYHLLWEAEWRRGRGSQRRDPMLLRRLGGDLFAVVAAWDLTEVEKLVLAR
jgi:hypothetical protein